MKTVIMSCAALAIVAGAAQADVYNDAVGDTDAFFSSQGFAHLDLKSVTITNDATTLFIDIEANADLNATTWGKYGVLFDTRAGGDGGNGWGRNIDSNGRLNDFWIGSWADDGGSGAGAELYEYNGANWGSPIAATYNAGTGITGDDSQHGAGRQRLAVSLAKLGLVVGSPFAFDVITTGGGFDPGVDHLSRNTPATPNWGTQSVAGTYLNYTVIPAPGAVALLGLAGIAAGRRRR